MLLWKRREPDIDHRRHQLQRQERTTSLMPRTKGFKWEVSASVVSIVQQAENRVLRLAGSLAFNS